MKCPKCGINYDDSDRECPMCGAPKPLFAKDKSQLAKTTARPASSDNKNNDTMGSILDLGSNKKSSWSKPKKDGKNKIGIIVIVAVVIINLIPALIGGLSNIVSDISGQMGNLTVQVEPELADVTKNSYVLDNDEIQFDIFSDGIYHIIGMDFNEYGAITTEYYDDLKVPEYETFLDNNNFIADDFNVFVYCIFEDLSQEYKYILVSESKSSEYIFFYDLNKDIAWLEDNVFVEGYKIV